MRRLFPVLTFVLILALAPAAWAGGALTWNRQLDVTPIADINRDIAYGDGVVVAVSDVGAPGSTTDLHVLALDPATGGTVWEDTIDFAGGGDFAMSVDVDGGRAFVGGAVNNATPNRDYFVRAYDVFEGTPLWSRRLDLQGRDTLVDLDAANGRVHTVGIGGRCHSYPVGDCDALIRTYRASDGHLLWKDRIDGADDFDSFEAVMVLADRVAAVGALTDAGGNVDFMVRVYDSASGVLQWSDVHDASPLDVAGSVAIDGGRVFVSGFTLPPGPGPLDALVRGYALGSGAQLWTERLTAAGESRPFVAASQGTVVVAGGVAKTPADFDYLVHAFDAASGDDRWDRRVDSGGWDLVEDLTIDRRLVITVGRHGAGCNPFSTSECDFTVRAYRLGGARLWQDVADVNIEDVAFSVAFGGGRVYAGGVTAFDDTDTALLFRTYEE